MCLVGTTSFAHKIMELVHENDGSEGGTNGQVEGKTTVKVRRRVVWWWVSDELATLVGAPLCRCGAPRAWCLWLAVRL